MKRIRKNIFSLSISAVSVICSFLFQASGEELEDLCKEDIVFEMGMKEQSLADFNYAEDAQYMFMKGANEQIIARCEDGYYVRVEDILYFADSELKNIVPLCYRVDCLHQEKTKMERATCGAYLGEQNFAPSISWNNGNLYVTSMFDIVNVDQKGHIQKTFKLSEDGLEKNVIEDLPVGIETATVVHRGYYYYSYAINESLEDGVVKQLRIIARMPVAGGEEEIIYSTYEPYVVDVIPYEEYVYFDYPVDGVDIHFVYHIDTGELKTMANPMNDDLYYSYLIEGDHLLWRGSRSFDPEATGWETIWKSELDGSNMEIAFSQMDFEGWDGEELILGTDGTWLYRDDFPISNETGEERKLLYYDRETLEYIGTVNLGTEMGWNRLFWGDDKYLFFVAYPEDDVTQICYIRKDELELGEAEVHILVEGSSYDTSWISSN